MLSLTNNLEIRRNMGEKARNFAKQLDIELMQEREKALTRIKHDLCILIRHLAYVNSLI